ncbi:MAG: thermonuclease family protein [bacterium]
MLSASKMYWIVVVTLFSVSIYFTISTELRRRAIPKGSGKDCLKNNEAAKVMRIIDSDEILVEQGTCRVTLRILGIKGFHPVKSPLHLQPIGRMAVARMNRYKGEKIIVFDKLKKLDPRSRTLAKISSDGNDIGFELVQSGLSLVYRKFPFKGEQRYIDAEERARGALKGLWSIPEAVIRATALQSAWTKARAK